MSWLKDNVLNPVKGTVSQMGKDAVAGALTGISGGSVGGANPENVPRNNVVVGQDSKGQSLAGVESGQVGVQRPAILAGYPSWALALGGASVLLLLVAGTAYMVKS